MFSFPILKPPLRFSDVEVIAVLATCLVNDFRPLGTIRRSLYGKKDLTRRVFRKITFRLTIR